jgi:YVTN family beta-propeller protein
VAVNSTTNKIFVTNNFLTDNGYDDDTVTVIDGSNNSASVLAGPGDPKGIAINSAINRVYVANYEASAVTVIDGATNQVATIAVGLQPSSIGVSVNPDLVFVANTGSSSLSVIDPTLSFTPAPPTVSITSPANGSVVSQTVTVQASASAGLALKGVQFQLDGANFGSMVTSAPYTMSWDTTQSANGGHTITAVAQDSAGNTASSSVTVTVANGTAYFALFAPANSINSETVAPGGTATYHLNLMSGTSFSGTVSLTCSGAPATAVCSISPASLSLSTDSTVPVTVNVATVAQSTSAARPGRRRAPFAFALALLVPFAFAAWQGNRLHQALWRWAAGGLLVLTILLACCGGGGSPAVTYFPLLKSAGTAAGTYTLTITATSASVTSTVNLTLTVT